MPSTIFAQFCQTLETIVDCSNATIFHLYHDVSHAVFPWKLTTNEFLELFYNQGIFHIRDCCDNVMQTDNWTWARIASGSGALGNGGKANIPQRVLEQWYIDASNNTGGNFHWETCSELVITAQLLQARNLCNLACNICCSLTLNEIVGILNAQDHQHRTPTSPFITGDDIILSLVFTNSSLLTNPVVFFFHFEVG